jgi:signal peptidase
MSFEARQQFIFSKGAVHASVSLKKPWMARIWQELRGFIFAIIVVLMIIGALVLYSGVWPPLVVVESGSMEHSSSTSYLGIIDTGDMVLIQKHTSTDGVITYVDGFSSNYRSFGEFGDVVIYERYGNPSQIPVIHRALVLLVYNETAKAFDAPSLANYPQDKWSHDGRQDGAWWNMSGILTLHHVGYRDQEVVISLKDMVRYGHGGLITKGDHNDAVDQNPMQPICREPIDGSWIKGVARGELPWFGLLKLWVGGQFVPYGPGVAANSWTALFTCLALIIIVPIVVDVVLILLKKRGIDPWASFKKKMRWLWNRGRKEGRK